jgi:alginate O-acetyltransferase complex protein AlgI
MVFHSTEFLWFFLLVAAAFFLVPARLQWAVLLVAGYVFYMWWKPSNAPLLVSATVVSWIAARSIHASQDPVVRRIWLWGAITVNLSVLLWYKYAGLLGSNLSAVLPIGISFYTFQSLAYTIDVYRGDVLPARHAGRYATFMAFFPQLLSGPVERASNLLPQLAKPITFDQQRTADGLQRILWGLVKKLVVADRIAPIVDHVYTDPSQHGGATLLLVVVLYSIQLYFDFSGYTDMALGAAQVLGIKLTENFRSPQLATSVQDFWSRWHITMSTWFRDYVYIPLGGNRVHVSRWYFNIMVVFFLSGIWHGAGWTFVCYGVLNGLYMVLALATRKWWRAFNARTGLVNMPRSHQALMIVGTFALATFSRIFFRADTMDQALAVVYGLATPWPDLSAPWSLAATFKPAVLAITLTIAFAALFLDHRIEPIARSTVRPRYRPLFNASLLVLLLLFGSFGETAFIYFQF